jgi:hypothetical protein
MMLSVEMPAPQIRPTLFRRLAILVGFGIVSSVAAGCSPATSSPLLPSASPGLPYSTLQGVNCADANGRERVPLCGPRDARNRAAMTSGPTP